MTQNFAISIIEMAKFNIFVIFSSEIRECPFFSFSEDQKPRKKGPPQKNGPLAQKNGSLTDFSYNSLISYTIPDL